MFDSVDFLVGLYAPGPPVLTDGLGKKTTAEPAVILDATATGRSADSDARATTANAAEVWAGDMDRSEDIPANLIDVLWMADVAWAAPNPFGGWTLRPDVAGRLGWEAPGLPESARWWARARFDDLPTGETPYAARDSLKA